LNGKEKGGATQAILSSRNPYQSERNGKGSIREVRQFRVLARLIHKKRKKNPPEIEDDLRGV